MRDPPTHLRFPLPPFSFSPPSLPPSHSPLLLSLFSLARSSPSAAQLYSTGIEMGLSRPGARREGGGRGRQRLIDGCSPHTHRVQGDGGLTVGGSAPPARRCRRRRLLVLVVLIAVQYGVVLHQREPSPTLLVQVGVGRLRPLAVDMDV